MATVAQEQPLTAEVAREEPQPAPAGDPAILGLISWIVVMAALTVGTLRLPVAYTAVIALGVYLFLSAAETATGGRGYPLGPALRR